MQIAVRVSMRHDTQNEGSPNIDCNAASFIASPSKPPICGGVAGWTSRSIALSPVVKQLYCRVPGKRTGGGRPRKARFRVTWPKSSHVTRRRFSFRAAREHCPRQERAPGRARSLLFSANAGLTLCQGAEQTGFGHQDTAALKGATEPPLVAGFRLRPAR